MLDQRTGMITAANLKPPVLRAGRFAGGGRPNPAIGFQAVQGAVSLARILSSLRTINVTPCKFPETSNMVAQ